jgi:hypothetical protein
MRIKLTQNTGDSQVNGSLYSNRNPLCIGNASGPDRVDIEKDKRTILRVKYRNIHMPYSGVQIITHTGFRYSESKCNVIRSSPGNRR